MRAIKIKALLTFLLVAPCLLIFAQRTAFINYSTIDSSVNPADDFFDFANGTWVKKITIPDEYSSWGEGRILYESNLNKLKTLLESAAKSKSAKGSLEQKVGDFYASALDTNALNKASYKPLMPVLQKIDAVNSYKELLALVAQLYKQGDDALLGFHVDADERNSAYNIPIFLQSGLTLPEKSYYLKRDSASVALKNKLANLATTYFKLTGSDAAAASNLGRAIVDLETKIADSHKSPVELRDPIANYNKMSVDEAEKLAPNIGWKILLPLMDVKTDSLNISQPEYFKKLSALLASEPLAVWKAKLKFDYINSKAAFLSNDFVTASFLFTKELTGQRKIQDRWKTAIAWTDDYLKDVLGQLYVKAYFPEEAKKRMDTLVNNLQLAFQNRIKNLSWMSDSTKQQALLKLSTIMKKIGYPTKWKNYDDVIISRQNLIYNLQSIGRHDYKEMISKVNKPVDKTEWIMTPPTINAYYNPTFNEIVFPAGILQLPFFDVHADDAVNYGGIGVVIGHELTHGFDDQGRQYDAYGNMNDWWKNADAENFKTRSQMMVEQYNQYVPLDTFHINGQLTLGENLADLGGVSIAYDAFKLTKQGQSNEKIDGFTPDQRFFLSYASISRAVLRPQALKTRLNTDPHSPSKYRVLGPLSNFEPFYKAFNVSENSKMYRKESDRVKVW